MTIRTTRTTISFKAPFRLACFDGDQPAGDYQLETDEELIEGVSRLAYRRVGAFLHIPRGSGIAVYSVNTQELETALAKDRQSEPVEKDGSET
jgi:hypothetical protein